MSSSRLAALAAAGTLLAGCGGTTSAPPPAGRSSPPATTAPAPSATGTQGPAGAGALQAEAASAATGDIPDNQAFLRYRDPAGWSMKHPEGWAQSRSGARLSFRDKNNIVRVVVLEGRPTQAAIRKELASTQGLRVKRGPDATTVSGAAAFKVVYTTTSAPSPVTGKRVTLAVDRYYLSHDGKEAIVDLGTPEGVDNVDAYRLMIQSFRWR